MEWYKNHFLLYMAQDEKTREASRRHWLKCHAENMASGRDEMIIFSAKMLAGIALADDILEKIH